VRTVSEQHIGRPRRVVADLPAYRPGKGAKQAEAEHGIENAIKLASNENPSEPLDAIVQAVCDAARGLNRYADHRAGAVRQALATRLGVDVERVTVGNGSVGLLQQVALTYLDDGDEALYPWRSFEAYPIYTALAGADSVQVPLAHDLGFDIDRLIDSVTPRTRSCSCRHPNNPTGVAMTTKEITSLVEGLPDDVMVVVDEAYREFLDPGFGDPVTELVPRYPNVLVMRTFSKAHALAGLRHRLRGRPPRRHHRRRQDAGAVRRERARAGSRAGRAGARARDRRAGAGDPRRAGPRRGRTARRRLGASRTTRPTSCTSRSGSGPTTSPTSSRSAAS
jgi:DNA-binding transcriptional MocR family regulator